MYFDLTRNVVVVFPMSLLVVAPAPPQQQQSVDGKEFKRKGFFSLVMVEFIQVLLL